MSTPEFIPNYIQDAVKKALIPSDKDVLIKDGEIYLHSKGGDVTLARAITRNVKLVDIFRVDQIRDMVSSIKMDYTPPTFWEPQTLEDYTKMYTDGPRSCMSNPPMTQYYNYHSALAIEMYEKHGLWSSIFYHYIPEIQGICMKMEDRIFTRSFLIPREDGGKMYNKIYGETKFMLAHEKEMLKRLIPLNSTPYFIQRFTVPAYESSVGPVIPLPSSIDFAFTSLHFMGYCKDDNKFYIEPNTLPIKDRRIKVTPSYAYQYYALASGDYHWSKATNYFQLDKAPW